MQGNPTERFWAKVEPRPSGCWEWTASRFLDRRGQPTYGTFRWNGRNQHAHRVSWELLYGPIPAGLFVLHSCDNPPCVRPSHLSLGTHRQNMEAMVTRLRYTHGRRHHSNRLTEDQVRAIRRRLATGEAVRALAREFGVTDAAIYLIGTGKNWGWLVA